MPLVSLLYVHYVVAANVLEGNHRKPNYAGSTSVVFTVPTLASVGLTVEAAHVKGLQFHIHGDETSQWYSSLRMGETTSGDTETRS